MQTSAPKNPKKFRGTQAGRRGNQVIRKGNQAGRNTLEIRKGADPAAPYGANRAHPSSVKNQTEAYASS